MAIRVAVASPLVTGADRRMMGVSLGFMAPVLYEFFTTGLVSRMPTWIGAVALMMMSFLSFTAALILDSVARSRAEQLRIHYLTLPSLSQLSAPAKVQTTQPKRAPKTKSETSRVTRGTTCTRTCPGFPMVVASMHDTRAIDGAAMATSNS